jgi:hypothetical protein
LRQKIIFLPILGWAREIFGVFHVKIHYFTPKKTYFYQSWGGGGPPLGKSDHSLISFVFNICVENQNTSKIRYKYDKADFESMRDILNIDWRTI